MADIYRKLEGDEVRFVRIQPGAWTDPIQCELVYQPLPNTEVDVVEAWFSGRPLPKLLHQELYDPRCLDTTESPEEGSTATEIPPFVALSYAWGDPNQTEELQLDDQPVQKTVNLIAGLRQLRAALLAKSCRAPDIFRNQLFWVDALCINQSDNAEKSAQVPRMGAIYGAAELVVAWLGENEESDANIDELMNLVQDVDVSEGPWSEKLLQIGETIAQLSSTKLLNVFHALSNIAKRAWYQRVWVVQEMTRARCAILLAGSHWCHFDHLPEIASTICDHVYKRKLAEIDLETENRLIVYHSLHMEVRTEVENIFKHRPTTEPDRSPMLPADERRYGSASGLVPESDETTMDQSRRSVFGDWVNLLQTSSGSPMAAKDALRTRLLAYILRKALSEMITALKAAVPHDYIYGILSIGGSTMHPGALAPDYSHRFADVFHAYSIAILEHTGDISIIPRATNRLEGVPSWVPDFRSVNSFAGSGVDPSPTNISILEGGWVCILRGVHLGEVVLVSEFCPGTIYEDEIHDTVNALDKFLEDVCTRQMRDKNTLMREVCHNLAEENVTLHAHGYSGTELLEAYEDSVSRLPCVNSQGGTTNSDAALSLFREFAKCSWTVTSQGLISGLVRQDERPKTGDILVGLGGAPTPWLLRPVIASDRAEYTVVGASSSLFPFSDSSLIQMHLDTEPREFRLV